MQERAKYIADSLTAAELRNRQLALAETEAKEMLRQATEKYNLLIEQAHKESHNILDSSRQKAFEDSHIIIENARSQIDILVLHAKKDLQNEVAELIMLGVQRIINKTISPDDHREIIDDLLKRLA
jgi:F-type H+-transporting ATPase subunit b